MEQTPAPNRQFPDGTKIDLVISKGPTPAETVVAPNLTDKTASEVDEILRDLKLIGRAADEVYSDLPAGHVAQQEPAPGTEMKAGDTIVYHMSKGTEKATVPNVINDTEDNAKATLEEDGFKVEVSYTSSSSVYAGRIVYTSPEPGESVDHGSTITIYVSTGPSYIDIPYVVGQDYESGTTILNNAGFYVDFSYAESDSAIGTIVAQSPTGTAVPGTTITLSISTGPATPDTPEGGGGGN